MILGIVGSPRKGGLTDRLVTRTMEGVESAGLETKKIYLADFEVPYYSEEVECPEELSRMCEEANALVVGAPVYYGDISGLTKAFMDVVHISNANGKYGLGISIAGGTGKGLCLAVQSIYSFFYHRQIRGIYPTPVSRFNFEEALKELYTSGEKLAELSREAKPFQDLWDRIEHYEKFPCLKHTFLDEIILLVEQLMEISENRATLARARQDYEIAKSLIGKGKRSESARYAVKAYHLLYF